MGKNASKTKALSHPKRCILETDKMDETDVGVALRLPV